ncbi:MAG TPA: hypothetical protein VNU96_05375 [Burkholderiales bacterium]|jgi:hypothetical protein|nr:hypothetical protein [Burkholderiales bacterium]HXJ50022.1 hypothetical protein [Burkholderiales bacterium]
MKPLTFEAVTRDPELKQMLIRQAHRERAEAIYRFIVEPVKSLFNLGNHHASGTHLAAARKG